MAKSTASVHRTVTKGFHIETPAENAGDRFSPTRYEPRSPPLSSVQEELASNENLLTVGAPTEGEVHAEIETDGVVSTIKKLDSLRFSYKENKFPIKDRGDAENRVK